MYDANPGSPTCENLEEDTASKQICLDGLEFGICTDENGKVL